MQYLGTTPYAAWQVSMVVALLMAVTGFVWLKWMIGRSLTAGERYDVRDGDPQPKTGGLPHPATGLVPLVAVLGVAFVLHDHLKQSALIVALLAGVLTVLVVNRKYFINLRPSPARSGPDRDHTWRFVLARSRSSRRPSRPPWTR
jgi:UDP-N-acetylmuramyl pentapeptide phosphotransferase/UDP-N-acetylglucosamine-1-phosphate transferase